MKKKFAVIIVLFVVMNIAGVALASTFDASQFIDWYIGEQKFQTVKNGAWSDDPNDQMSDEELEEIFKIANHMQSAVQWTPWYFVAVKDVDEQRKIIGDAWGAPEDMATAGTVTVLVLSDQILSEAEGHVTPYEGTYMHVPQWGYFDTGAATALLHMGAASLGYYTHYFGTINGEYAPKDLADGKYISMDRYVTEEDQRGWGYMGGVYGGEQNQDFVYPVKGNAVFVAAIVIGKPANEAEVDVVTWATNRARPENWKIWD